MSKGGINKVILLGNLGDDPEIRHTANGNKVANFSIATTSSWKDGNDQWQEKTEWHNITVWRHLADTAESYLQKGQQVYIEGKLETSSWEDNEGVKRYKTSVVANDLQMTGSRRNREDGGGGNGAEYAPQPKAASMEAFGLVDTPANDGGDDLPF